MGGRRLPASLSPPNTHIDVRIGEVCVCDKEEMD